MEADLTEVLELVLAYHGTDREATGVMGSSWGALISLWAAVERGGDFGLLGAMSPAITPGQEPILRRLRHLRHVPERAWIDTGEHEGSFMPTTEQDRAVSAKALRDGRRVRDALITGGVTAPDRLRYLEEPGAIHHEAAWSRRLPDALRFLFGPLR